MKFWPLFRLLKEAPGLRVLTIAGILLALMEAIAAPIQAHIIRDLVDGVLVNQTSNFRLLTIVGLSLMAILGIVAWVRSWVMGHISERGAAFLRKKAVESMVKMPFARLDVIHSGDYLSRLTNDASVVRHYLYFELFWLVSLPTAAILGLGYLFYIDWIMTLVTMAMIPVFIWLTSKTSGPLNKISAKFQEQLAQVNNTTQDTLAGAEVVKAFNLQSEMEARQSIPLEKSVATGLRRAKQQMLVRAVSVITGFLPFLLPLSLGGWFALSGRISAGSLVGFIVMLNSVTNPMMRLPGAIAEHQKAMASMERLFQLKDEPRERRDGQEFSNGQDVVLEARGLVFGYDNGPVLNGLDLELHRGETVALVGPSGAGKSTVFKVLTGLYPTQQGQVYIYHRPLEQWNLAAARRQIALVSQDTFLFPGSIAENIALGRPQANQEEIKTAAIQANAHEFIQEFPQGYDHVLSERGANLSGGQRQRLAIARAILLDAPILLLDEATSALDTESERLVQDALEQMTSSRTTLVIAHRLSTIRNAHRILVLDQGKIVESGTHTELLAEQGLYHQLYVKQLSDNAETGGAAS